MSKKKHQHHKPNKKKVPKNDEARILYFVDENGKKVKVDKKTGKRIRMRRGLFFIIRRNVRTWLVERRAQKVARTERRVVSRVIAAMDENEHENEKFEQKAELVKAAQQIETEQVETVRAESASVVEQVAHKGSDKDFAAENVDGAKEVSALTGIIAAGAGAVKEAHQVCSGAVCTWARGAWTRAQEAVNVSVDGLEAGVKKVLSETKHAADFVWRDGVIGFVRSRRDVWHRRVNAVIGFPTLLFAEIGGFVGARFQTVRNWVRSKREAYSARRTDRVATADEEGERYEMIVEDDGAEDVQEAEEVEGVITYTTHEGDVQVARTKKRAIVFGVFGTLWRVVRSIFFSLVDVVILVALAGVVLFIYLWHTTPSADNMFGENQIAETTVIYDRTGQTVMYEIHGEEDRKTVTHEEITDYMRFATIAAEDDAFYGHFGIDPFSILRAVKENLIQDGYAQGGSTITQQLARNVFLTRDKTLKRKALEAVMAVKIEKTYTKDEILDAYLNVVPYGSNAYGVEAAAEAYFGKHSSELTLDEAAMLASLPKATTTFSPYGTHTNRLIARQKMILERMRELGLVPEDVIDAALEADTLAKVRPFRAEIVSPHFVFHAIEELEQKYDRDFVERGGLKVYTTIDLGMQAMAEEVVKQGVANNVRYNAENAALTAVDPRTGEILTMVGSKDYYATDIDGQVNVATRLRQPGSSFKPFAYATAFAKGYQPETVVFDVLTNFGPDGTGKNYMPQNYTGRFHGLVSFRDALAQSLNIPAVKALYLAGIDATIDTAQNMGITSLTERNRYGLALVLGGAEVKPMEMAAAFGVFANDGVRVPVHAISRIEDRDGNVLYDAATDIDPARAIDQQVARKINSILSDNNARTPAFGRNNQLVIPGKTVAAKTGTTQNYRDAWTVGYTPEIAVSVWAGNNDNQPMAGGAGAYAAAPIWQAFMMRVLADRADVPFTDYVKVETNVPMVGGKAQPQRYVVGDNRVVGAQYEPKKKEEVRTVYHTILYYIDKNKPLTSTSANRSDPMLSRWEGSLHTTPKN